MLPGLMRLLFLAWKHTGGRADPFRMAHVVGEDYRPLDDPEGEPKPPRSHRRIRNVIFAFAAVAEDEALSLAAPQV